MPDSSTASPAYDPDAAAPAGTQEIPQLLASMAGPENSDTESEIDSDAEAGMPAALWKSEDASSVSGPTQLPENGVLQVINSDGDVLIEVLGGPESLAREEGRR